MADEASETFGGGFRNYVGALGFIIPLVGFEELVRHFVDTQHPSLPLWASLTLIAAGLPIYFLVPVLKRVRVAFTASSAAPKAENTLASGASVRLLFRPNQDPQELSKDNVWRWFVYQIVNENPLTKERLSLGTYIFITFNRPVSTSYRRVFSPSHPSLTFKILDLNQRTMVIALDNEDLQSMGATIEIHVSDTPI